MMLPFYSFTSKLLLILDGLDELRQELLPCIQPLIQGKIFSNTFLVLTARHEAGITQQRYCDTLLEIIGYTTDDEDSYITKYFSKHENQSLAKKKNDLSAERQHKVERGNG